jgi:MFS family permease
MWTRVLALGSTQTLAWASSTYLIAIVAAPISRDLVIPVSTVFAAFSVALIVTGLLGPAVGRLIDRRGGRGALALSNGVLAAGLLLLGLANGVLVLFAAWIVLGIGMALGLYDAAFAALVRIYGSNARGPITGITLIAGFASTIGWPLTAFLVEEHGWRVSCFAWAAIHVLVALPLNLTLIPARADSSARKSALTTDTLARPGARAETTARSQKRAFVLVAVFASMAAFVTSAMAAHLPGLLQAAGASQAAALTAAALVGPAQVGARLIEFIAAKRFEFHPLLTARTAVALHPCGAILLVLSGGGAWAASLFAVLHGAGNGMVTIARGTLPLAIFGPTGYGERQGLIGVSARSTQAVAPFALGLILERVGTTAALGLTTACSLAALGALLALRTSDR